MFNFLSIPSFCLVNLVNLVRRMSTFAAIDCQEAILNPPFHSLPTVTLPEPCLPRTWVWTLPGVGKLETGEIDPSSP